MNLLKMLEAIRRRYEENVAPAIKDNQHDEKLRLEIDSIAGSLYELREKIRQLHSGPALTAAADEQDQELRLERLTAEMNLPPNNSQRYWKDLDLFFKGYLAQLKLSLSRKDYQIEDYAPRD